MAYNKTEWIDNNLPAINADNLNKMEDGIYNASKSSLFKAKIATFDDVQKGDVVILRNDGDIEKIENSDIPYNIPENGKFVYENSNINFPNSDVSPVNKERMFNFYRKELTDTLEVNFGDITGTGNSTLIDYTYLDLGVDSDYMDGYCVVAHHTDPNKCIIIYRDALKNVVLRTVSLSGGVLTASTEQKFKPQNTVNNNTVRYITITRMPENNKFMIGYNVHNNDFNNNFTLRVITLNDVDNTFVLGSERVITESYGNWEYSNEFKIVFDLFDPEFFYFYFNWTHPTNVRRVKLQTWRYITSTDSYIQRGGAGASWGGVDLTKISSTILEGNHGTLMPIPTLEKKYLFIFGDYTNNQVYLSLIDLTGVSGGQIGNPDHVVRHQDTAIDNEFCIGSHIAIDDQGRFSIIYGTDTSCMVQNGVIDKVNDTFTLNELIEVHPSKSYQNRVHFINDEGRTANSFGSFPTNPSGVCFVAQSSVAGGNNFDKDKIIGCANENGDIGDFIDINTLGNVIDGFTGLTIGADYYVDLDGNLTETFDAQFLDFGYALSETEILTKEKK